MPENSNAPASATQELSPGALLTDDQVQDGVEELEALGMGQDAYLRILVRTNADAKSFEADLDRWKERAAIFEDRLARIADEHESLDRRQRECRKQSVEASRQGRTNDYTRLAAKASAYRHAAELIFAAALGTDASEGGGS